MPVTALLPPASALLRPARPLMPAGMALTRLGPGVIQHGTPVMPPADGLIRLGWAVMRLGDAVIPSGRPVIWLGGPLIPPGWALIWFGWALIWAPSALPDGFYVVLADWGQNSGRLWSKRDSLTPLAGHRHALTGLRPPAQGCQGGRDYLGCGWKDGPIRNGLRPPDPTGRNPSRIRDFPDA